MKIKKLTYLVVLLCFLGFSTSINAEKIKWETDLEKALELAEKQDKKVFIFYTGDYCPPCQNMKRGLFRMEEVVSYLNKNYVSVEFEVFKKAQTVLPRFVLITPDLKKEWQWEGTISSEQLLQELGANIPVAAPTPELAVKIEKPQKVEETVTIEETPVINETPAINEVPEVNEVIVNNKPSVQLEKPEKPAPQSSVNEHEPKPVFAATSVSASLNPTAVSGNYLIQFGAFSYPENAQKLHNRIAEKLHIDTEIMKKGEYTVVVLKGFEHRSQAAAVLAKVKKGGFKGLVTKLKTV